MTLHFRAELLKHQKIGYQFNAESDELVAINKQLHNARAAVVGGIAVGPVPLSQGAVTLQVVETPEPLQLSGNPEADWNAALKYGHDASTRLTPRDPVDIYHDEHESDERRADIDPKSRDVFVVHGRDDASKEQVARVLQKHAKDSRRPPMKDADRVLIIHGHDERNLLALKDLLQAKLKLPEPVVMAQQMIPGASLPEKFERLAASVGFAVALLTPDDVGRASTETKVRPRPRQNTLVEIGWFWGRLGRDRVLLLVKEDLELPSDLQGVEYHRFRSKVEEVSEKLRDFFDAHRTVRGDG